MNIKMTKAVKGIPLARVVASVASPGAHDARAAQVVAHISAIDCYDLATVVASLRMSPVEARDLAERLMAAARAAEDMAGAS